MTNEKHAFEVLFHSLRGGQQFLFPVSTSIYLHPLPCHFSQPGHYHNNAHNSQNICSSPTRTLVGKSAISSITRQI